MAQRNPIDKQELPDRPSKTGQLTLEQGQLIDLLARDYVEKMIAENYLKGNNDDHDHRLN